MMISCVKSAPLPSLLRLKLITAVNCFVSGARIPPGKFTGSTTASIWSFSSDVSRTADPVPRILSVGRLVAFKGFENLIDACGGVAQGGLDFTCEIIGDGPLRDDLQAKIDTLKLSPRVKLLGSLSQEAVIEKLRAADIFALASVTDRQGASDVFPTVIIEAMAAARPVVSTRLAGIPELVAHGETGLLVAPGDTSALEQALERLIRNPELRSHYGRAGRARIEQHFRIEHTVAPLLQLFEGRPNLVSAKSQSADPRFGERSGYREPSDRIPD